MYILNTIGGFYEMLYTWTLRIFSHYCDFSLPNDKLVPFASPIYGDLIFLSLSLYFLF